MLTPIIGDRSPISHLDENLALPNALLRSFKIEKLFCTMKARLALDVRWMRLSCS